MRRLVVLCSRFRARAQLTATGPDDLLDVEAVAHSLVLRGG
jgi:hypothetical protein